MRLSANYNWRDFTDPTVTPLLQKALAEFVKHGYHGTSIRMLASNVGISVAGLYHHYPSKQAIIVQIMELAMADLYERSLGALEEAGEGIEERFRLHVECLVLFHAHRADLAFVAANEIRALEPEARQRHIASRDRQQLLLSDIVDEGKSQGIFPSPYPHDTTRAIITMCTGVSQWFRLGGGLSPEALAERYAQICRNALGCP